MFKILQFIFEGLLVLVLISFTYSQMVRPLVKKTPVFPFFRRRPNVEGKIEKTDEILEDQGLLRDLKRKEKLVKHSK